MAEPHIIATDDLTGAAAELTARELSATVAQKGEASFVLAGGGTPLALYRALASPPLSLAVPWSRVHFFWGDERLVPPGDPGSNYTAAAETLLTPLAIPTSHIHRMRGELPALEAEADYAEQLRDWAKAHDPGAPHPWPRFDLVLLGLGSDGHTASLFPGSTPATAGPVAAVTADYQGRPAGRVTLTPLALNDAHHVVFLVSGSGKADAVYNTLHRDDPSRFPAQRIRPGKGRVTWLLDRAAASMLDRPLP
ncbi:MAG: 6-phosphogluconolactonase [Candidatus Promineofilum sp.]|nr:6-phosphogluconolactonase [Promineifilum sp.]